MPDKYLHAPVVVLLHGHSKTSEQLLGITGDPAPYKVWLDFAQEAQVLLIVPEGLYTSEDEKGWNDCRSDAPTNSIEDDVLFIDLLLDSVLAQYQADERRVYVNGTSNGGHFAIRLAQELPGKLTAFAAITAANATNSHCAPLRSESPYPPCS